MRLEEMNDGRYVGWSVSEIMSFPPQNDNENVTAAQQQMQDAFSRILTEFQQSGSGVDVMAELTWITEPVSQQTFSSRVRAFLSLRAIASGTDEVEAWINQLYYSMQVALQALNFRLQQNTENSLQSLYANVDKSCALALVKECRTTATMGYSAPYYYCNPVSRQESDDLTSLITALGQCSSCMVSIQVFPAMLSVQERLYLSSAPGELNAMMRDAQIRGVYIDASFPAAEHALSYSLKNIDQLLLFNLLVIGQRSQCIAVSGKLLGMASWDACGHMFCYDISQEGVDPATEPYLYPWNINNRLIYGYQAQAGLLPTCYRLPNLMSPSELATFFCLPIRSVRMVPLRQSDRDIGQEQLAKAIVDPQNVQVGFLLNHPEIGIGFPDKLFTKHMLIVGMPGCGKTTFCFYVLLQFAKRGIPFLIIEPTKSEYRSMIDVLPDLQIFTPGNNGVSPFIINPFIPPTGITVEKYIPSLFSAFHAAFSMPSPLDVIFLRAIRQTYMVYGWKDTSCTGDPDVKPFGIYEFILEFKKIVDNANYANEVKGNLQSAGTFRLMNLIEQNSNIYDTVNTTPLEDLLSHPTVLELNSIDDGQQKALLMSLILISICAYTKHNQMGDGKLKNLLLIDEAHVLLAPGPVVGDGGTDVQSQAVARLQNMIAEIRSYGTGILIADQSPSRVTREVVANTDIKVAFRLVQGVDRELIADSCNMSQRASQELSKLGPGQAYTYCSLLEYPQVITSPDVRKEEGIRLSIPDKEIAERSTYWQSHPQLLRPFTWCTYCKECSECCDMSLRAQADYWAAKMVLHYASDIKNTADLERHTNGMRIHMGKRMNDYSPEQQNRLIHCIQIRFLRKMQMSSGIALPEKTVRMILSREEHLQTLSCFHAGTV